MLFGSARFSPPRCYQVSQASHHQYYMQICRPLLPNRFGSAGLFGSVFYSSMATFLKQSRRVSLGKALQPPHIPSACISVRFAGYWISPIHDCSILSPIPFRRFAVRYVRRFTSCFFSTRRFCSRSCPVGVALPSGNGGQFYFRLNEPEDQS